MSYTLGKRGNKWVQRWKPTHHSHPVSEKYVYENKDFSMLAMGDCFECKDKSALLLGNHCDKSPDKINLKDVEMDCKNKHTRARYPVGINSIYVKINSINIGIRICISALCVTCKVSEPIPAFQGGVGEWQNLQAQQCCDNPKILFTFSEISVFESVQGVLQDTINPRQDCAFCMDSDELEADITCKNCLVVYHEKCCVKWLEQQKYLKCFNCVHCTAPVTGLNYEKDPRGYIVFTQSKKMYLEDVKDYIGKLEDPPVSSVVSPLRLPNSFILFNHFLTFKTKEQAETVMDDLTQKGGTVKWNRNHLRHLRIQFEKYLKKNKLI